MGVDRAVVSRGMRMLGRAIRDEPHVFAIAVTGSIAFSLTVIGAAFVIGALIEHIIEPAFASGKVTAGALGMVALALFAVMTVRIAGILGRRLAGGLMQFRLFAGYRRRLARKLLQLSPQWHRQHSTGTLLSSVNSDVETAFGVIAPLPFAVGTVALIGVSLVALAFVDISFVLIAAVLFPAIFILNYLYSRVIAPRARVAQQAKAAASSVAHESFDGALVVKTLGAEEYETRRFAHKAERLRDAQIAVGRIRGIFDPFMDALPALATLAALYVGAWRASEGTLAVSDVVTATYLFTVLALPLRAIGWVLGDMPRAVAGWERVQSILSATDDVTYGSTTAPPNGPATIEIRNASVRYGNTPILRDVSLTVPPARTVALVGPTGSGKSTVVALLARLVDPVEGHVALDGIDLREFADGELPAHVTWVSQTAFIFDDTVLANITLGDDSVSEQQLADVWEALRVAHLDAVVAALPDGLNTRIGERGASLSGGQRQRLALARAIYRKPRLLLLDDATSAVDPAVEQRILHNLRETEHATTVVLVAYRRGSIALADEVAYLEDGRLIAQGLHEHLIEAVPGYADVVTAYDRARREAASPDDIVSEEEVLA